MLNFSQLLSEKNYLIEQLQTANVERGALNQFQNNYYQFIQVQQQDLETLNRENMVLRQQLEMEKSQVSGNLIVCILLSLLSIFQL